MLGRLVKTRDMLVLASMLMVSAVVPTSVRAAATQHRVRPGDTLWELARAHGCSVEELRRANALSKGGLRVGMKLQLPRCSRPAKAAKTRTHVVSRGETLGALARRYGTEVDALRRANGLRGDIIMVGQSLTIPGASPPKVRLVKGQSVGAPQKGTLEDGAQLPRSRSYYRRRIPRTYAAQHVIDQVTAAVATVRAAHPKTHRLAIGDLSDSDGGYLSGHNSHQSGRDVDLGFYFEKRPSGYPKEFVSASGGKLDVAAMWTLIDALYEQSKKSGGPSKVFLDYRVQKRIYAYAKSQKVSAARLAKIFQAPDGRWAAGRLVQHVRNHHDHLHVRFGCPPQDDACKGG